MKSVLFVNHFGGAFFGCRRRFFGCRRRFFSSPFKELKKKSARIRVLMCPGDGNRLGENIPPNIVQIRWLWRELWRFYGKKGAKTNSWLNA